MASSTCILSIQISGWNVSSIRKSLRKWENSLLISPVLRLPVLLDQEKSEEVGEFLSAVHSDMMGITDFSLHSIGVITTRLKRPDIFTAFVNDTCIEGAVNIISLVPEDLKNLFILWRFSISTLMMRTSTRRQMSMDMFS